MRRWDVTTQGRKANIWCMYQVTDLLVQRKQPGVDGSPRTAARTPPGIYYNDTVFDARRQTAETGYGHVSCNNHIGTGKEAGNMPTVFHMRRARSRRQPVGEPDGHRRIIAGRRKFCLIQSYGSGRQEGGAELKMRLASRLLAAK